MAQLGIKMIEMYCKMIADEFGPLKRKVEERISQEIRDEVEKQVKIDLGVYDMYMQKEALQLQIIEIEKKLKKYESTGGYGSDYHTSIINKEVEKRMSLLNAPLTKIEEAEDKIIKQVKLTGVSTDVKDIFDKIGEEIINLKTKYSSLPPITVLTVRALSNPRKGK